jgi:hypothetical protein
MNNKTKRVKNIRRSFGSQVIDMVEPVVATEVVFEGNAQLHLAAVVQELNYEVFIVELEAGPQLFHRVVANHPGWFLLPLFVHAETQLIDHPCALLPPSEER